MEEVVFWKSKKFWFGLAAPILLIAVMCLIGTNTWICEYLFARGITRWLTHVLTDQQSDSTFHCRASGLFSAAGSCRRGHLLHHSSRMAALAESSCWNRSDSIVGAIFV